MLRRLQTAAEKTPRSEEAKRLRLIVKALASIGIGIEQGSVGHVVLALSIISIVGDEVLIKGDIRSILEDMIQHRVGTHRLGGAD